MIQLTSFNEAGAGSSGIQVVDRGIIRLCAASMRPELGAPEYHGYVWEGVVYPYASMRPELGAPEYRAVRITGSDLRAASMRPELGAPEYKMP